MIERVVEFDGFHVTLKELTVRAIISIITNLPELFSDEPEEGDRQALGEIVIKHRKFLLDTLRPFVIRSDGQPIESLTDEIEALHEPFMEATPLFLPLVSEMIRPRHIVAASEEMGE